MMRFSKTPDWHRQHHVHPVCGEGYAETTFFSRMGSSNANLRPDKFCGDGCANDWGNVATNIQRWGKAGVIKFPPSLGGRTLDDRQGIVLFVASASSIA
ncbi:hypothetical protein [Burkholderia anthina]|uniref:hypothetical protein n=1 Tax=Burkholderia anthina TaxID=179879 RepID=UPI001AA062F0|nr:hypothetical protein [Burkholderia anthina]QTD88934.1 hypothetical protein J4G50_14070 [Burkholderia anthina]